MPSRNKDRFETRPPIGDDRDAARGGFEQPHARRITHADPVGPRDVESKTLTRIKPPVAAGTDMFYALDIGRPRDFGGIEGAGYCEKLLRTVAGGAAHQLFEGRLAVSAVGAEVTHVPDRVCGGRRMAVGIDRAIKHSRCARMVPTFEHLQRAAAGK